LTPVRAVGTIGKNIFPKPFLYFEILKKSQSFAVALWQYIIYIATSSGEVVEGLPPLPLLIVPLVKSRTEQRAKSSTTPEKKEPFFLKSSQMEMFPNGQPTGRNFGTV
jgi:hypothetical protein